MSTLAQWLIAALEARGMDTVFGIPGVHTIALYRGLEDSRLRHVTPRHEQGAGFMADGYARATGRPAACFIITGPGMTNIATAMAQALADSVPMLVISSVNRVGELGMRQGRLHELPSQQQTMAGVSVFSHTLLDPANLLEVLDRAFAVFETARSGPVHIEIPRDLFDRPAPMPAPGTPPLLYAPGPHPEAIAEIAERLNQAESPLVLLGGGAIGDPAAARALVECLDAPALTTINARGLLGREHPLDLGSNGSWGPVREYAAQADVVLAIGTEIGETDYDLVFDGGFELYGDLIRIDIDATQLTGSYRPAIGLVSAVGPAMAALVPRVEPRKRGGAGVCAALYKRMALHERADLAPFVSFFAAIERAMPDAILVGDSAAPVYAGNHLVQRNHIRRWFNSSTGYGTLGYGLPAALGARLGRPDLPVIALIGDGGLMFTLGELSAARDEQLPVVTIVWNNAGYEEIRRAMDMAGVAHCGVDPTPPDLECLATGFGCQWQRVADPASLEATLRQASDAASPWLIEVDAVAWWAAVAH